MKITIEDLKTLNRLGLIPGYLTEGWRKEHPGNCPIKNTEDLPPLVFLLSGISLALYTVTLIIPSDYLLAIVLFRILGGVMFTISLMSIRMSPAYDFSRALGKLADWYTSQNDSGTRLKDLFGASQATLQTHALNMVRLAAKRLIEAENRYGRTSPEADAERHEFKTRYWFFRQFSLVSEKEGIFFEGFGDSPR